MAKGIPVTKQEFEKAKKMAKFGVPQNMISEFLSRDEGTISMMVRCSTFEEYVEVRKAVNSRKKTSETKPVTYSPSVQELLSSQNEKMAEIVGYIRDCARLLNGLAEAWKK